MTCRHRAGMIALSTGVKPPDLTATLSPANTSQASPGAQVVTASATGGEGSISYSFDAKYPDGTSANALLTGSGSSRTVTTTAYSQTVVVTVTATDSGTPTAQTATARAVVATVVPADLVASMSPATTSQASPGAVVLTASSTGGVGTVSWAWSAKYADGSSAAALLSALVGSPVTLTTTTPGQSVRVVATATDAAGQTSSASALVAVAQPAAPTLSGPAPSAIDAPGSASVTFTGASGYGALSYSATLSAPAGSAATLSGSGLGAYTFTTDVEGAYAVTLTLTDALGRTAAATGIVSLVSAGALWTQFFLEDFDTYDAASRSGNGTLALQKAGVTQYTGTLSITAGTTGSAGIDANGMFLTQASGTGQAFFSIAPTIDTTKWLAFQWLIDWPTISGTSVTTRAAAKSITGVASGTEVYPAILANDTIAGKVDIRCLMSLGGVSGTAGNHADSITAPSRVCVTLVIRGGQSLSLVHDSSTFVPMQDIDDSPYGAAIELDKADTSASNGYALMFTPINVGIQHGSGTGTMRVRSMRGLYATPRSN